MTGCSGLSHRGLLPSDRASEPWPQRDAITGSLTPQAGLTVLGEPFPHSLAWLKTPPREESISYKYCLDSTGGAEGGMGLRAS